MAGGYTQDKNYNSVDDATECNALYEFINHLYPQYKTNSENQGTQNEHSHSLQPTRSFGRGFRPSPSKQEELFHEIIENVGHFREHSCFKNRRPIDKYKIYAMKGIGSSMKDESSIDRGNIGKMESQLHQYVDAEEENYDKDNKFEDKKIWKDNDDDRHWVSNISDHDMEQSCVISKATGYGRGRGLISGQGGNRGVGRGYGRGRVYQSPPVTHVDQENTAFDDGEKHLTSDENYSDKNQIKRDVICEPTSNMASYNDTLCSRGLYILPVLRIWGHKCSNWPLDEPSSEQEKITIDKDTKRFPSSKENNSDQNQRLTMQGDNETVNEPSEQRMGAIRKTFIGKSRTKLETRKIDRPDGEKVVSAPNADLPKDCTLSKSNTVDNEDVCEQKTRPLSFSRPKTRNTLECKAYDPHDLAIGRGRSRSRNRGHIVGCGYNSGGGRGCSRGKDWRRGAGRDQQCGLSALGVPSKPVNPKYTMDASVFTEILENVKRGIIVDDTPVDLDLLKIKNKIFNDKHRRKNKAKRVSRCRSKRNNSHYGVEHPETATGSKYSESITVSTDNNQNYNVGDCYQTPQDMDRCLQQTECIKELDVTETASSLYTIEQNNEEMVSECRNENKSSVYEIENPENNTEELKYNQPGPAQSSMDNYSIDMVIRGTALTQSSIVVPSIISLLEPGMKGVMQICERNGLYGQYLIATLSCNEHLPELAKLMSNEFYEACESLPYDTFNPQIGELIVALSPLEDSWVRAFFLGANNNKYIIASAETGLLEGVQKIKQLPKQYQEIATFAVTCVMKYLYVDKICDIVNVDCEFSIEIKQVNPRCVNVELSNNNESLCVLDVVGWTPPFHLFSSM